MTTSKSIDNIFKVYTAESCYWAGFLSADGSIDCNGTVSFELNNKDIAAIHSFQKVLDSEHSISYRNSTDASRIRFNNKALTESLYYNFGVGVNKTFELSLPVLPLEMYPHFIRGHYDGDGCLTEFFANRPLASYRVYITSGSLSFLEELKQFLKDNRVISGGSIQQKAARCWHIQLAVKDSTTFLDYIYKDSLPETRLSRKYDKYKLIVIDGIRQRR